MSDAFKIWMSSANSRQKIKLAEKAKTTVGSLFQIVGGYRNQGRVSTSPELARRIEIASLELAEEGLPIVRREDLCAACGGCEYAKDAAKGRS